ncbi:Flp family type IVb pilin [Sinomonas sp. ASV486]|uniref:Flp family type IVb pilin n=1 Tax=Sinomonas sp. ASV486 TaxID=3051170 RepID=UPI0027DBD443|nr:Flp family type IVb pilin [Sinomonas sp. ASV486]MDQ4488803.1 Flp family type IVb pilin [Sinomonas sp. ASV486]
MDKLMVSLMTFWNDITSTEKEKGATATEYALLVGLIALIIAVGVLAFGGALNTWFNNLATKVAAW